MIEDEELDDYEIYKTIEKTYKNSKLNTAMELFRDYEITTINLNELLDTLTLNRFNIKKVKCE